MKLGKLVLVINLNFNYLFLKNYLKLFSCSIIIKIKKLKNIKIIFI